MRAGTLTQFETGDEGTFGTLTLDDGWSCFTAELPWRDNATGKSCIPGGTYRCVQISSPKHGLCYLLRDVPGREDVEIHAANFAGDVDRGWTSELLGCIALGAGVVKLPNLHGNMQEAVNSSRATVAEFMLHLGGEDLMLTINRGDAP